MKKILDEILDVKLEEVKKLRKEFSHSRFADSEYFDKQRLSLFDAVTKNNDVSIIAEVKKASPSKGIIRQDFNHLKIAEIYFENETAAVSVLTDKFFFRGDIKFLRDIANIKTAPLLRKDFVIDEFQIYEAKSNGADAVLLISEILSANQIAEFTHAAEETDLEILLEFHSADELKKINFERNRLIGINNRNLNDFSVSLYNSIEIMTSIPEDYAVVSESGISSQDDIQKIKNAGINAVLIGENFMRAENISDAVKQMKEWCADES